MLATFARAFLDELVRQQLGQLLAEGTIVERVTFVHAFAQEIVMRHAYPTQTNIITDRSRCLAMESFAQQQHTFDCSSLFELVAREQCENAAVVGRQALQHDSDMLGACLI